MDENLVKDDLLDPLKKFEAFEDFSCNEQQSIHEYIATFEANTGKFLKK